jgi:hypothetical protein
MKTDRIIIKKENEGKSAELKAQLLSLGYGVTEIAGVYVENYNTSDAIEVKENSFIVIDIKNKGNLKKDLAELGKPFFGKEGEFHSKINSRPFIFKENTNNRIDILTNYSISEIRSIKNLAEKANIENYNICGV